VNAGTPSSLNMQYNFNYNKRLFKFEQGDTGLDAIATSDIIIPPELADRVLSDEMVDGSRIIIFCSAFGIGVLQNFGNEVAVDGTFSVN
jgi:hypothetical protein